jgi:hypothetical protein
MTVLSVPMLRWKICGAPVCRAKLKQSFSPFSSSGYLMLRAITWLSLLLASQFVPLPHQYDRLL